jgi:hypothetical protein
LTQVDRPVHAEVGSRSLGEFADQFDVHRDRSVLYRRSTLITVPLMIPLCVSIVAGSPNRTSRACLSEIFSSAI